MNISPIVFLWSGEVMAPLPRFDNRCAQQYVVGETYCLAPMEARSYSTHNHFFASINEAWKNLPEDQAVHFATPEHLRKWALCKAGFADERSIVCSSKAEALRLAAFIKPMDEYAVVVVSEASVRVFTAQSQSMRAMGKKDFQASKQAVLEILSAMIDVEPRALARETGKAA